MKTAELTIAAKPATRRKLIAEGVQVHAAYYAALDAHTAAQNAAKALHAIRGLTTISDEANDAEFDAWCEAIEGVSAECGTYPALTALTAAENTLIDWASRTMKAYHPVLYKLVAISFEKGPTRPVTRAKLIELCLRFKG